MEKIVWFRNGIWDLIRGITDSIDSILQPICSAYSLTTIQVRILVELYYNGAHSIGSLAKTVNLIGANCSSMCKVMEKRGYLKRERDTQDERVVKLALTDLGRETVEDIEKTFKEKFQTAIPDTCVDDLENIQISLRKLADILDLMVKK